MCGGSTWECCLCLPQKETLLGAARQWARAGGAPGKGPSPQFLVEVGWSDIPCSRLPLPISGVGVRGLYAECCVSAAPPASHLPSWPQTSGSAPLRPSSFIQTAPEKSPPGSLLGSLEAGEEIVSIPGDVEMYMSPGFLGHAAVFGFPLSLGSPPWGAHSGPSLLGLVSVFLVPLLEGSTGVAEPSTARLQPGALGRRCDDVMWPPASCLAASGRICLFWHRGLFHMEGQEQAVAVTRALLALLASPLPRGDPGVPWCPGRVGRRGLEWSSSAVWEA